jgi:hypothetical protein
MPVDDKRLGELVQTLEAMRRKYSALDLADAFKAANSTVGSTVAELNQTAAAKLDWEAAELALMLYRARHL